MSATGVYSVRNVNHKAKKPRKWFVCEASHHMHAAQQYFRGARKEQECEVWVGDAKAYGIQRANIGSVRYINRAESGLVRIKADVSGGGRRVEFDMLRAELEGKSKSDLHQIAQEALGEDEEDKELVMSLHKSLYYAARKAEEAKQAQQEQAEDAGATSSM